MVDTELIAQQLKSYGHAVTHITPVSANAGDFEFTVDGKILNLEETRALLAKDEQNSPARHRR